MTSTSIKFTTEHYAFHVLSTEDEWKRTDRKTRVSGPNADMSDIPTPPYGSRRGDGSEGDQAWKAYNREELKRMKASLADVLAELTNPDHEDTEIEGVDGDTLFAVIDALSSKLSYSRKAGCSCGCSPAFISGGRFRMAAPTSYNPNATRSIDTIFISVKKPERTFTMADFDLVTN